MNPAKPIGNIKENNAPLSLKQAQYHRDHMEPKKITTKGLNKILRCNQFERWRGERERENYSVVQDYK